MAGTKTYRGRLAPTPSGYLHLGHARTFKTAADRAEAAGGELIFRMDDLDLDRCRPEYARAAYEDLRWLGLDWVEGPDVGGASMPYDQSQRGHFYFHAWTALLEAGAIYPSPHSRRDVAGALSAPHGEEQGGREPVFPPSLRVLRVEKVDEPGAVNWRFRVPDGARITFADGRCGEQRFVAGEDFGDFLVWRKDGFPSYDLACVTDDYTMHITEVVRGEDLLLSTARQLLLYRALGWAAPDFFHCPLLRDARGQRLAKRSDALSLRALREAGFSPAELLDSQFDLNPFLV